MIAVFGDSIAFGMFDVEGGWAERLKKDFKVINKSIPGETTDGLLKRIKKDLEKINPEIVIIAVGINDSSFIMKKNIVSLEEFKENYMQIIKISKKYAKLILCLGLTYVDETKVNPDNIESYHIFKNSSVKKYNDIIKIFSQKEKTGYLNIYDLLKNKDLNDGLHPNSKGHEKIYEKIKNYISDLTDSK